MATINLFRVGDIVTPVKTNDYLECRRNRPKVYPPEGTTGKVLAIDRHAIPTVAMVDWGEFGVLFVKIKLLKFA